MKKRFIKILTSIACLACVATAGIGVSQLSGKEVLPAQAYEAVLVGDATMQEWYAYGSTFTAPAATVGGVQATKTVVISPDGKAYENQAVVLKEEGTYTVVWYASVSGKTVSAKKQFRVIKEVFSTSDGASWEYVEQLTCVTPTDTDGDGAVENRSGLKVSLAPESTFYFNRAIDVTQAQEIPLFEIYPYNQSNMVEGYNGAKIEARTIVFTLTDCYDPSISVSIYMKWRDGKPNAYFSVAAHNQKRTSAVARAENYVIKKNKEVYIDGTRYEVVYESSEGTNTDSPNADEYGYQLLYDYTEQRFTKNAWYPKYEKYTQRLISDLDNTTIYDTNPFTGFTTGEVYLSIRAEDFESDVCNIEFSSIKQLSGEDFKTLIESEKDDADVKAPVVTVDKALQNGNVKVALNETVTIPDALAFDLSLPVGTKAEKAVYYAYDPNKSDNIRVGLKNGTFTPTKAGAYSIVYSATDKYGNVGTAVVALECAAAANNQTVSIEVPAKQTAQAGETFVLPTCALNGLYTDAENVKTYIQFNGGEKRELTVESILLDGVGTYTLTYEYAAPLKTYVATMEIVATASDIVNVGEPVLPEYIIAGARYTLDTVYAYEYKGETPTAVAAATYMSVNGGEYQAIDYEDFTVADEGTVQFKYVYGDTQRYSDIVPVIDVGFGNELHMNEYCRIDETELSCTTEKDGLKFTSLLGDGDSTITYAQPISLYNFSIEFMVMADVLAVEDDPSTEKDEMVLPEDYGTLTGVTITLIDYYDRTNTVELHYIRKGNIAWLAVDDADEATLKRAFAGDRVQIIYDANKGGFVENAKTYAWENDFTSDRALLRITMEGIADNACLKIRKLNDQALTNRINDTEKPSIYVGGLSNGIYALGRVVDLGAAQVGDVLSPYLKGNLTLSVRTPNGSWATSLDGVALDGTCAVDRNYQIKLDSYGTYVVMYRYTDQAGNGESLGYSLIVDDRVKPTITLEDVVDGEVIEAVVGERVTLSEYTYADDQSLPEEMTTYVTVFTPTLVRAVIEDGTFLAERTGNYTVLYACYDANGNYATALYTVHVSE